MVFNYLCLLEDLLSVYIMTKQNSHGVHVRLITLCYSYSLCTSVVGDYVPTTSDGALFCSNLLKPTLIFPHCDGQNIWRTDLPGIVIILEIYLYECIETIMQVL